MTVDVLELLRSAAPDLAAAVEGVSDEAIRAVECAVGVEFPAAYRSFLLTMGESTAGFHFGSSSQTSRFTDLIAELDPPEERSARYWRMTIERDLYHPVPTDFYLDLNTSDGQDAELLRLEHPPCPEDELPTVQTTFFDRLRLRIFAQYIGTGMDNLFLCHVDDSADIAQTNQAVRHLLAHEGLKEFAPYRDKLALFARADLSVVFRAPWGLVFTEASVGIRAKRRDDALLLVEKLRDHIPAPVHVSPPRR